MTVLYNVNPTFHVLFRDADGTPLIGGSVTTKKATDHLTDLATYEDRAGTIPLPNPIPLNAAGLVSDSTGAPKPLYLGDDQNYYIEVRNSVGTLVQSVDNWNADNAFSSTPQIDDSNLTNYINNAQWRELIHDKVLYPTDDLPAATVVPIAWENWNYNQIGSASTNQIEFKEFALGQIDVPYNPKYYLNFTCSANLAETEKDIYVELGDSFTFSNQTLTFGIRAKSATSSTIEILTRQYFGSGGSATVDTVVDTFTLTSSWAQYETTFVVEDVLGKSIGSGDKFSIILRMPLNAICNIDMANNQLNVGSVLLEFDFVAQEMEEANAVGIAIPTPESADRFSSPITDEDAIGMSWGSIPPAGSIVEFAGGTEPTGWLECDGQTIDGLDEKYERLYSVIKNRYGFGDDGFDTRDESGYTTIFYTKPGNVTDISDGTTGFSFSTLVQGGAKGFSVDIIENGKIRITNTANGSVTDTAAGTSGFTVTKIQEGTGSLPEISEVVAIPGSTLAGKYFLISSTITDFYIWFTVNGVGSDPVVGGRTGIQIAVHAASLKHPVATACSRVLNGSEHAVILCNAASTLSGGEYFNFENQATTQFYIWYTKNGVGVDPAPGGKGVLVPLASADTAAQLSFKTKEAFVKIFFSRPDLRGYFVRGWDHGAGVDPNANARFTIEGDAGFAGDNVGSYQEDENLSHTHTFPTYEGVGVVANRTEGKDVLNPLSTTTTNSSGGAESRPVNIYMMKIIKY